jgi:hypothetical protein
MDIYHTSNYIMALFRKSYLITTIINQCEPIFDPHPEVLSLSLARSEHLLPFVKRNLC